MHHDSPSRSSSSRGLGQLFRPPYQWVFSKLVEWWGNRVTIDGCSFTVDSPAIHPKSRFLFDRYEPVLRRAIKRFLDPELPVIELGSAIGVVSCLANKLLKNPERHVAVEANPHLVPLLRENCRRNGCRFSVLHRVLAYGAPEATFCLDDNFTGSSIHGNSENKVTVPSVTLEAIVNDFQFETCTLLCDVEGSEVELVEHEAEVLSSRVAMLFIEIHEWLGKEALGRLTKRLGQLGFTCALQADDDYVFLNPRYKPTSNHLSSAA